VVFTGQLEPIYQARAGGNGHSVYDLIAASDLCSFLTSQDYESFGNPIAEAIMLHRPYLSSSYDRYRHCYADKGYRGLVFPVFEGRDGPMDLPFASEGYRFLKDGQARTRLVEHNDAIWAREHPPVEDLAAKLGRVFSLRLGEG